MMKAKFYLIAVILVSYSNIIHAQKKSLTLGFFPYVSTSKLIIHNKPFTNYINKTTNYSLSLITAKDLPIYIKNLKSYNYDLIFCAPHLARYVEKKLNYKRVVMTTHKIKGVYIVKNDSPIHMLEQLKGKTISLTPPITILHQMALSQLNKYGMIPGENIKIKQMKTFSNAIYDVISGSSDVALTGSKLWKKIPISTKKKFKKIAQTPATSGFIVLAKPSIDNSVIINLQHAFLAFNKTEAAKKYIFKGFKLITDPDMTPLDFYSKIFE